METTNQFVIYPGENSTYLSVSAGLGRILSHRQIPEIIHSFGSEAKIVHGNGAIEIVPPIPIKELPLLKKALEDFAKSLDPDGPETKAIIRGVDDV
jgi:hypothetical protein